MLQSYASSQRSRQNNNPFLTEGVIVSLGLFGATAYWFVHKVARPQRRILATPFHERRQKSLTDLSLSTKHVTGEVSVRGRTALVPVSPYLGHFLKCLQNPCDPIQNPRGYIALCVAENKLVTHMLVERCMDAATTTAAFGDDAVYCYHNVLGLPLAREAAAYFLARRFLFPDDTSVPPPVALRNIRPQHVALGAGAAVILNNLFFLLGDAGDACLIPAPYYAAFENDMNLVGGVVPFAVRQANPVQGPTPAELDLAYMQAKSAGLNPRFLLLTNPNNPLAVIHKRDVMYKAVEWARKRKLQTIVDEIYALSTHQKYGHGFESIIRILDNDLGTDVHMLWAISKDIGASGMRYGILYSQNELLMEALTSLSTFSSVSGPIQYLVSELLTDDQFLDIFLDESRDRLVHSYNICTTKLEEMVIPFVPAEAGMFVYVDFSSLLPQKTVEWERRLSELLFKVHVVLTPGESQHDAQPGMFRICYAWVPPDILEIAMERLSKLVAKLRRMDWDDLDDRALSGVIYPKSK